MVLVSYINVFAQKTTPQNSWGGPDKNQLLQLLQSSLDTLLQDVGNMQEKDFFKIPNDSAWSVAQVLERLSQIEEGYLREYFVAINMSAAHPA